MIKCVDVESNEWAVGFYMFSLSGFCTEVCVHLFLHSKVLCLFDFYFFVCFV